MIAINPQTLTVTRPGVTTYVNGIATEAAGTTFTIVAEVQPLSGTDREDLTEGYRKGRTLKIYTETPLTVINLTLRRKGDQITYQGQLFEVISEDNRIINLDIFPVAHYKYILSLLGVDV